MENAKQMATPISTTCYLDKDEADQLVEINIDVWFDLFFIYQQVDLISCLVFVYVLDIKSIPKNLT